jgi:hypothetical protein
MDETILTSFALQNGLVLKKDVFHGASGVEFRKPEKDGIVCLGYFIAGSEVEIYIRRLGKYHELINDKLWMLGGVFRLFGYKPDTQYRCIDRLKMSEFTHAKFIKVVQVELIAS